MTNNSNTPAKSPVLLTTPEREAMLARYHALTEASNARLKAQAELRAKTAEVISQASDHEKAQQIRRMVRFVLKGVEVPLNFCASQK